MRRFIEIKTHLKPDILRALRVFFAIVCVALSLTVIFAGLWARHNIPDSPTSFLRSLIAIGMLVAVPLAAIAAQYDLRVARFHETLNRLAMTDSLTGLLNRRRFRELAELALLTVKRQKRATAMILLDLDHFKSVNDTHGHQGGDDLLKLVSQRVQSELRDPADHVGRWGGEELIVLVANVSLDQALSVAERLRRQVETAKIYRSGIAVSTTASLGVSMMIAGDTIDDAIERADAALYEAKSGGRNCVRTRLVPPRIQRVPAGGDQDRDAAADTSSRTPSPISGLSRA